MRGPLSEAEAAFARGAYVQSLRHYEAALSADPDNAAIFAKLSICLALLNRRFSALKASERALQLAPDSALPHVAHSLALMLLDDAGGARRSLRAAMAIDPFNPDALHLQCTIALQKSEPGKLREAAEELLRARPWDVEAKQFLSRAASLEGKGVEAERLAREALNSNPQSSSNHAAIGWAFLAQRKPKLAVDAALNALQISGTNRDALALLALARLRAKPLTGWFHFLNLWLIQKSETQQIVILLLYFGISDAIEEVLEHYQLTQVEFAFDVFGWAVLALLLGSWWIMQAALRKDLANVRLRSSY